MGGGGSKKGPVYIDQKNIYANSDNEPKTNEFIYKTPEYFSNYYKFRKYNFIFILLILLLLLFIIFLNNKHKNKMKKSYIIH
jgi:hypothetical protein